MTTAVQQKDLHAAINSRDAAKVRALIFHEANSCISYQSRETVLHRICIMQDKMLLHALLHPPTAKEVKNLNAKQITDCIAMQKTCLEVADYFGRNPLHITVEQNNIQMTKMLLKYGANADTRIHTCGCSSLHIAVTNDYQKIVKLLLKWRADVNARNYVNESVLDVTDPTDYIMIKTLSDAGAVAHLYSTRDLFWDTETEDEDDKRNYSHSRREHG